ncbi:MAG TPA: plastocyanin/azurin family copper-binding protein [Acidimicrobiia bacterium]|nr:plastocyanin/azurin family copper-binding protein [Acidimicrobiia bacterium]
MRRSVTFALGLVLALAACGGGGGGGGGGSSNAPVKPGARQITVDAQNYDFKPNNLTVKAGENIAIKLHSEDSLHNFTIQNKGLVVSVDPGKTATGGFTLAKAGKYTFYCSIPGHRAAGMVGTITVT